MATTPRPTSGPEFRAALQRKARLCAALRPSGSIRKLHADRADLAARVEWISREIADQRAFAARCGRETSFVYLEQDLTTAQRRLAALDAEIARREVRK